MFSLVYYQWNRWLQGRWHKCRNPNANRQQQGSKANQNPKSKMSNVMGGQFDGRAGAVVLG
jgi:hypothetical protein